MRWSRERSLAAPLPYLTLPHLPTAFAPTDPPILDDDEDDDEEDEVEIAASISSARFVKR